MRAYLDPVEIAWKFPNTFRANIHASSNSPVRSLNEKRIQMSTILFLLIFYRLDVNVS